MSAANKRDKSEIACSNCGALISECDADPCFGVDDPRDDEDPRDLVEIFADRYPRGWPFRSVPY